MSKTTVSDPHNGFDKEKVIARVKTLIRDEKVKLNTRFLHSHSKVALMVEGHIIEICGAEGRHIRYESFNISLTAREHKEIMDLFTAEVTRRKEKDSRKKLEELKVLIKG